MKRLPARALAAQLVHDVLVTGRSLDAALATHAVRDQADAALVQELAYGTLRWAIRLDVALATLLREPLRERDQDIQCLLRVGLYQLLFMTLPAPLAVDATVDASAAFKKPWSRALLNGVLRNAVRQLDTLRAQAENDPVARHSHPAWLLARLQHDWPHHWQQIATANNARAPMTLRVNLARGSRDAYLARLRDAGLAASPVTGIETAIALDTPCAVTALPGFRDGDVSVQDGASQLATILLDVQPGERVLDACAAPGSKTGHLLERAPGLALVAIDQDAKRLERLRDNLARLGQAAEVIAADVAATDRWWDGAPFDRVLLDAPCSGTGVIRRHPDIKALRRETDIAALGLGQARLLDRLWPLVRPGGMLLYTTCSMLAEENALQIERFLARTPAARALPVDVRERLGLPPLAVSAGAQLLPGEAGLDGFYYARLQKCE